MDNEFLANIQQEGTEVDFDKLGTPAESETPEKETPAASPAEKEPKEEPEPSPEPKVEEPAKAEPEAKEDAKAFHAFHEHPRWIAREAELKQLREKVDEYEEFKSRVDPILEKLEKPTPEVSSAPQWFTNLFGTDENAWSQYQESSKEERKRIREEILT